MESCLKNKAFLWFALFCEGHSLPKELLLKHFVRCVCFFLKGSLTSPEAAFNSARKRVQSAL